MRKRILWLVVSGLMALSLPIAACAPAATPTAPVTPGPAPAPAAPATPAAPVTPIAPEAGKPPPEAVKSTEVKPKYGGTLFLGLTADVTTFAGIENC
jgi:hypothetical protein